MSLARRSAAALIMDATSMTAGVVRDFCRSSDCISRMASTLRSCELEEMNSISVRRGEDDFLHGDDGSGCSGRRGRGFGCRGSVVDGDRCFDFGAKTQSRRDLHASFEAQFVQKMQILRLSHHDYELIAGCFQRKGAATARHGGGDQAQSLGVNLDVAAIEIGNS